MAKWYFRAIDNGGKHQHFVVSANNKTDAIKKGFERAKKYSAGDIHFWECKLQQA